MQYLMMDLHQRFIGTLNHNSKLSIGDTFKVDNAKTYMVVRIDASRSNDRNVKSLTVIARNGATVPVAAAAAK